MAPAKELPEGNVVVEALDSAGHVLATTPTTIVASDAGVGGEGPWTAQLTVDVAPGTAGTIRGPFALLPADNSILAEVAINVTYGVAPPPVGPLITIEIPLPGEDHQRRGGRCCGNWHSSAGKQRHRARPRC